MARRSRRRRVINGVILAVVVVGLVVGAVVLQRWKPFEDSDDHPAAWPESVQPLADFVEGVTSLTFQHPVKVRFLGLNAYNDELRDVLAATPAPTAEELERTADTDAIARALGLISRTDSLSSERTVSSFGPVFFDREHDEVLVRSDEDDLPVGVRVRLISSLTQVLQLQRLRGAQTVRDLPTLQQQATLVGLLGGQTLWATERYVDSLSIADRGELNNGNDPESVLDRSPTQQAFGVAAQQLGATFVEALRQTDRALIMKAINDDRPTALDQLGLPATKYLSRDTTEHVDAPPVPRGGELVRSGEFGYLTTYLALSLGSPDNVALTAADGWGADAFTAYRLDDRLCVDMHVVADSRSDADRLDDAIQGWAASRPDESGAQVGRDGTSIYVSICDPGTEVDQDTPASDAIDELLGRAFQVRKESRSLLDPALAECVWVAIYADHSQDDFRELLPEDVEAEAAERRATCADEL